MAINVTKGYKTVHHWGQWLSHPLGKNLLIAEKRALTQLLQHHYGKQALLIGVSEQKCLLKSSVMSCQFVLGPILNRDASIKYIESELSELAIQSGSVDLVILPHIFELIDNPHKLISEACRIVKPEGHIFILGFNPMSSWGLRKIFSHQKKNLPWSANFIPIIKIKEWLNLSDFELESQKMILFRPPFSNPNIFQKLKFLEWLGKKCYKPFGGVYILQAKAKVIPLTPIKMRWQQELSGIRISPNILPGGTI